MDACARTLRAAILSGQLAPGERLPPERRLAESFGVNRVTLRGALARLASARMLRVRQGSGYVVRDYRDAGGPDLLPGLTELANARGDLSNVVADLLLMRRHLARAVLERLSAPRAEVAGARDAIARAVDAFELAIRKGAGERAIAEADLDVVGAILDATGSAVLRLCMNPLSQVVSGMAPLRKHMYAAPETNLAGWRMLVGWMEHRRADLIDSVVAELERRDAATVQAIEGAS